MSNFSRIIPIYTTQGDCGAFLAYPYIFSRQGEWIGWVTSERQVYSVHGHYVGFIGDGPRILRRNSDSIGKSRQNPPVEPSGFQIPTSIPLAPLMSELPYGLIDVLEDAPNLMPSIDYGDLREDMD